MPLLVTIDSGQRVIKTRGWGDISEGDLLQTRERLASAAERDLSFSRLCDLSEATSISISDEMIERWASDPIASPPVPHAVVCTAPVVMKRVLEYVSSARRHLHEVLVFPSYEAAAKWMHLESGVGRSAA